MAYIGKEPQIGNYSVLDALSASATADYTLQLASTNFVPESANHLIVSLNGVIQKPGSSFTVGGSTLSFASSLTSSDSIDFVIALGNVLDIGVPSDDTVGAAQIKDDLISGTTALASEPADTDEFLVSDAGTLKRIDYSLIKGGGKVLQVVTANHSTTVANTGTSYATSGLSAAITPSASSSKILVLTSSLIETFGDGSNSSGRRGKVALFRGTVSGTQLREGFVGQNMVSGTTSTNDTSYNLVSFSHLDSPSTTDETTYTVGIAGDGACDVRAQHDSDMSTITLLEIGA